MKLLFSLLFCVITSSLYAQNTDVQYIQGSPKPSFSNALMGVRSYNFDCISNGQRIGDECAFIDAFFIEEMKQWCAATLPSAQFGIDYKYPSSTHLLMVASYSHRTQMNWNGVWQWYVSNIKIMCYFGTSDAYNYEFSLPNFKVKGNDFSVHHVYNALRENLSGYIRNYDRSYVLQLPKYKTKWNESTLRNYYTSYGDVVEGIYESTAPTNGTKGNKYKLGLKKMNDGSYALIYLDGANLFDDWSEGEVKAFLTPTSTQGIYKAKWLMLNKSISTDYYITLSAGTMQVRGEGTTETYIKMYPTAEMEAKNSASSGTGFFLSNDGYIITNYHVVENARTIKISGINDDNKTSYTARIEITDKQNDLAILKITDSQFRKIDRIPYAFKFNTSNVGEDCFVLGYPLISTMGMDIKLTNGIISSKTGYDGNIAQYQISAPVQPGNSGGPLFDKQGNVIGIVQAKHTQAENAGYAIKSIYIRNLVELLPTTIAFPQTNQLAKKSLPQQVQLASKAVCVIIVNGD